MKETAKARRSEDAKEQPLAREVAGAIGVLDSLLAITLPDVDAAIAAEERAVVRLREQFERSAAEPRNKLAALRKLRPIVAARNGVAIHRKPRTPRQQKAAAQPAIAGPAATATAQGPPAADLIAAHLRREGACQADRIAVVLDLDIQDVMAILNGDDGRFVKRPMGRGGFGWDVWRSGLGQAES
jgi:hypothetical protein